MLDMPFEFDVRLFGRAIRRAEVVSIFFPWFGKALIIDTRYDALTPPAIFVDDMAGSADERLQSLVRQRPSLGRATRLTALPWPAGVASFEEYGLDDRIRARVHSLGFHELERDCARALAQLRAAERAMKLAYVRGEYGRTLYPT